MRLAHVITKVCVVSVCVCARVASSPTPQATNVTKATPLILEKNEGEHRIFRPWPGHPGESETFYLKVDPKNGGSSHLVLGTANLPAGQEIDKHRHPESDEILLLQSGTARVQLGDAAREVHAGATVFIPANTWISVKNIGSDAVDLVFIFSAPGFEELMRDTSVRVGEKVVPITQTEEDQIEKKHAHHVVFQ